MLAASLGAVAHAREPGLPLEPTRKLEYEVEQGTWLSLDLSPDGRTIVFDMLTEFLRSLNEEEGVALLLVEQNAHLAFELCSRAYVLEAGRCVLAGESAELERNALVRTAYLGGGLEIGEQ